MLKRLHTMGILAGLCLLLAACNSGEVSGIGSIDNTSILGKWYLRTSKQEGTVRYHMTTPKDTVIVMPIRIESTFTGNEYYLEIKNDGTFSATLPGEGLLKTSAALILSAGTWSLKGNELTTVSPGNDGPPDTVKATVGFKNGTLTTVSRILDVQALEADTTAYDITSTQTFSK